MDKELTTAFTEIMFETCRDQVDEVKAYNAADAGEKMRRCYNKFYMLLKHQNDYYEAMPKAQFDELMKP